MEDTIVNKQKINLMDFEWRPKTIEYRTEKLVKQIVFPELIKEESNKIECQIDE